MTPLHCDFDDNIFAQIRGTKRIFLAPPHHDEFLYVREANPVLFGSPVDPEAPDFERQVPALSFSLSANRWARGVPLALHDDPTVRPASA